jgi:sulfopyruvate decarboxylase alpha subunit
MAKKAAAKKTPARRSSPAKKLSWQEAVYNKLRDADVTQFSYVPDAGHAYLIDRSLADPEVQSIALTAEEEGIALAAGAHLGGAKSVVLMQSSGVGNCINMLSLTDYCKFPLLIIVSMRGDYGEGNPWQFAMGRAVTPVLESMGVQVLEANDEEDVLKTVDAALTMVNQSGMQVAVLLTQRLLGAKSFA